MSAVIVEAASVSIPLLGANLTENDMVESQLVSHAISRRSPYPSSKMTPNPSIERTPCGLSGPLISSVR